MSYHRRYKLKDYQFGLQSQALREKAALTQAELAALMKVTERAVQHWESGSGYPAETNLKKLIEIYLHRESFTLEHERDEAKAFWEQASQSSSRRQSSFDDAWFATRLSQRPSPLDQDEMPIRWGKSGSSVLLSQENAIKEQTFPTFQTLSLLRETDWGEAVDVTSFCGRGRELDELEQWVRIDRCRVVTLLGMGGIGKTVLSIKLAQQISPHYQFVFWRSLYNAPSLETVLNDCIQMFSEHQYTILPQEKEQCITLLIELLRERRCFMVFDNVETILQEGHPEGGFREGHEGYGRLIQRVAEAEHQSCLLLTSRELPSELALLEGLHSPIRVLRVVGLDQTASQEMLKDKGIFGTLSAWDVLVKHYSGNPLALKIVSEAVRELFGGDIAAFLRVGYTTFHDILQLLNHQFKRLSPLEKDVMYWLAIEREPISLEALHALLVHRRPMGELIEALTSLRRRSLIERGELGAIFALQPVVLEYMTEQLVEQVSEEIRNEQPVLLLKYALMRGQAKEYIRTSQVRLIILPIIERVMFNLESEQEVQHRLICLLPLLREKRLATQGYGGGNVVNLLAQLKGEIRGIDFSSLLIRQAYLQEVEAQDASFANAALTASVFMETFDSIASVAVSQNGQYLAAGSFNGHIRVWKMTDGQPLLAFMGHTRMVWSIAFSPDSTTLVSGGYDHSVKMWEVSSGRCLKILQGHTKWVRCIAFSPDGHILMTSADDGTIRMWDVQNGACVRVLDENVAIWSVAFSPDGSTFASGSDDGVVKLWEVFSGRCFETFPAHLGKVWSVAFSPDGSTFASGSDDGVVKLWEISSGKCLKTLRGHASRVWSIAFSPDGTILASGSHDGMVKVWEVSSGKCLKTLRGHASRVWSIAFSPDGTILVSGGYDGMVKLWEISSGYCLRTFQGHTRLICSTVFSLDGMILMSGSDKGIISIWDVASGRRLKKVQGHRDRIWSMALHPNGEVLASCGDDRVIKLWEVHSGRCLKTFEGHTAEVWSVAFSPDGTMLATSSIDGTVKLWEVEGEFGGRCLRTLKHTNWVWTVTFSPDGTLLVSGCADGKVTLWQVSDGTSLRTLQGSASPIGSLAFSFDGRTITSSSNDEIIKVWEVSSGICLNTYQGQNFANWVKTVAFSPDGTMLATGSSDSTVQIWDVSTGRISRILAHNTGRVWSIAFSSDSRLLASGDDDGTILLWDMQTGCCLKVLRDERPYERTNIFGVNGITEAQRTSLKLLGACETPEDIGNEVSHPRCMS